MSWRNNKRLWHDCRTWLIEKTHEREELGIKTYGPEFVGDPLEQLGEELADALFYSYAARRRQDTAAILLQEAIIDKDWVLAEKAFDTLVGKE